MYPAFILLLILLNRPMTDDILGNRFEELKSRFESREKLFEEELTIARGLGGEAKVKQLEQATNSFNRDRYEMIQDILKLIRMHPNDPATLDGIILLNARLNYGFDDDIVKIVRDHFMNDPRMDTLCASIMRLPVDFPGEILREVSEKHPDRNVRGRATYRLGVWAKQASGPNTLARVRTIEERERCRVEAERAFVRFLEEYPDVISVDGKENYAVAAKGALIQIRNLVNLSIGKQAPEIVGEDLDGKPLKLSDYRGKVVVLCFWATWCGPCMQSVPHERELVQRMNGKPFALLGVNTDQESDRAKAKKISIQSQMSWPSWWDGATPQRIQSTYSVTALPTIYVLDAKGIIQFFDVRGKALDEAVDKLIREMASGLRSDTE
jgi:thiol-disulfide isomerase/thioredoxin